MSGGIAGVAMAPSAPGWAFSWERTEIPKGLTTASGLQHWKLLTALMKDGLNDKTRFCASTVAKIKMMSIKVNGAVLLSKLLAPGKCC